jgi:hypothetical protein
MYLRQVVSSPNPHTLDSHSIWSTHTPKTHKFHPQAAQTLFYKVLGRYIYIKQMVVHTQFTT